MERDRIGFRVKECLRDLNNVWNNTGLSLPVYDYLFLTAFPIFFIFESHNQIESHDFLLGKIFTKTGNPVIKMLVYFSF